MPINVNGHQISAVHLIQDGVTTNLNQVICNGHVVFNYMRQLDPPQNVRMQGVWILWERVEDAEAYEVYVGSGSTFTLIGTSSPTAKLETPINELISNDAYSFDAVDNASRYQIIAHRDGVEDIVLGTIFHGETWTIKSDAYLGNGGIDANVQFVSNSQLFNRIHGSAGSDIPSQLLYDNTSVATISGESEPGAGKISGWENESYRTITLANAPTGDFANWLNDNAIKQ